MTNKWWDVRYSSEGTWRTSVRDNLRAWQKKGREFWLYFEAKEDLTYWRKLRWYLVGFLCMVSLRSQNINIREFIEFNPLFQLFLSLSANYYKKQNMVIITGMKARCFSCFKCAWLKNLLNNWIPINTYKLKGLLGSCPRCFFRSLRGQTLACAEGCKKEEIMGKEGKRNEAKEMECTAWTGARWLLSVRNIILIFSYSSLLAWWLLLPFNRIACHQWWIRQGFALA